MVKLPTTPEEAEAELAKAEGELATTCIIVIPVIVVCAIIYLFIR